jgi:hypothetical protein
MRRFAWLGVPLLLTACAPDDIVKGTCRSVMLAAGDPWECTVKGDRVGQDSAVYFSTESRNKIANVKIALFVRKGTLRVRFSDVHGGKQIVVTPEQPAKLEMRTPLHPERRDFGMHFEPLGGPVEGLTGTVDYDTR